MFSGHMVPGAKEQYTEDTLFKVYDALREDAGLTEKQTRACIDAMRKRGILFRESVPVSTIPGTTPRGVLNVGLSDAETTPA